MSSSTEAVTQNSTPKPWPRPSTFTLPKTHFGNEVRVQKYWTSEERLMDKNKEQRIKKDYEIILHTKPELEQNDINLPFSNKDWAFW